MALSIPNTFTPETVALSAEVNENFTAVADQAVAKSGDTMTGALTTPGVVISGTGASALDVAGGIQAGTGNVGIVDATGKIPEISSTYFASVSGANLTTLPVLSQTFRGLTLRTHPNADVAAYKVYLDHADEIVMHDGTRVADWDDLTADITASGAGGLDTGSEGASRWYEIHAIRKSSDGTKNLLLHRAKDYAKDTAFETTNDTGRYLRIATATATDKIAQGFIAPTGGACQFADLQVNKGGAPTGNIWLTIEADSAGSPSGTPLATSDKLDVSLLSGSVLWVRFVFRSPTTLVASTQYHLVLQGDYTRSDTVCASWRGVVAGGYASGVSKEYNGTSWSASTGANGLDRNFRLYVTANEAAVTMPTGYDQRCLVGWVYNDSGSNFVASVATDRFVRKLVDQDAGSLSATIPTLIDLSALMPPTPSVLTIVGRNDTATQYTVVAGVPEGFGVNIGVGNAGGVRFTSPTAAVPVWAEVATDYQSVYALVSANTGNLWAVGYRW